MHVKRRKPALLLFRFRGLLFLPKPVVPALCSFIFVNCHQTFTHIARGNHLHCSWQFRPTASGFGEKLVIFSKKIKDFLNSSLCFLKVGAGILKSWPTILKSPPAIQKGSGCSPKTQAVLPAFPARLIMHKTALDKKLSLYDKKKSRFENIAVKDPYHAPTMWAHLLMQ
jgi:hypothetical protein